MAYHDPVSMTPFVVPELLPTTEAGRAYVDTIAILADWVGTYYSDGVCEVAGAAITRDLQARLIDGYYVIRGEVREKPKRRKKVGHKVRETGRDVLWISSGW